MRPELLSLRWDGGYPSMSPELCYLSSVGWDISKHEPIAVLSLRWDGGYRSMSPELCYHSGGMRDIKA